MISHVLAEDLELRRQRDRDRMFPLGPGEPKQIMVDVSISDIAVGVGVDKATISRIFSGDKSPTLERMEQIAAYLSKVKGRQITCHDVIDLIKSKPWTQPLNIRDYQRNQWQR